MIIDVLNIVAQRQHDPDFVFDVCEALSKAYQTGKRVLAFRLRDYVGLVWALPTGEIVLDKTVKRWNGDFVRGEIMPLSKDGNWVSLPGSKEPQALRERFFSFDAFVDHE
jgi:hypothetical protein